MSVTSAMRAAWAPACTGPLTRLHLHGDGRITVRSATVEAFTKLNECLVKHNYRTRREDTGAFNCRRITGGSAYSLHAYGIAADLNWRTNPYGAKLVTDMPIAMIEDIESIHTRSGVRVFRWGGRYSGNKDAMHFEVVCTPQELASGVMIYSAEPPVYPPHPEVPKPTPPVQVPKPTPSTDKQSGADMYIAVSGIGFFAQFGNATVPLPGLDLAGFGALTSGPNAAPVLIIPEAAAHDFVAKAIKQTAVATGG